MRSPRRGSEELTPRTGSMGQLGDVWLQGEHGRGAVSRCQTPPPNLYVPVLTPGPSGCDLVWKSGLYRSSQVTIRSLGWALIQ